MHHTNVKNKSPIVSGGRLFGRTSAVGTSQEPTKTCFDAPRAALSDPRTCPTHGHLKSRKPKSPRCCKLAREQAAWPQAAWRRPARSRTFRSGARCFLRSLSAGRFFFSPVFFPAPSGRPAGMMQPAVCFTRWIQVAFRILRLLATCKKAFQKMLV